MAKSKGVNKSEMIRDALAKHPDKSPSEIAELLKDVKVTAAYVSMIKSKAKNQSGKTAKKPGRKSRGFEIGNGIAAINAAVVFVKAAGGIEQAKAALETVAEIGRAIG